MTAAFLILLGSVLLLELAAPAKEAFAALDVAQGEDEEIL